MDDKTSHHKPRKGPLHDEHLALEASMTEFGGYIMPVRYSSIIQEHRTVRKAAGLFDTSHMGEFIISGKDAEAFLQSVLTNDVTRCTPGKALYTTMCLPTGGTIDDLYIYNLGGITWSNYKDTYMLVVNAANTEKDFTWLQDKADEYAGDVTLKDISSDIAMLALQGPKAEEILQQLTDVQLQDLVRFDVTSAKVAERDVLISRTGYSGEDGFELYLGNEQAAELWKALLDEGKSYGLLPAGLGARDTLRLEACYPLYGHELGENISPIEAGIGWAVRETEPASIGSDVLLKQKNEGAERELIAFEITERAIPRQQCQVFKDDAEIGEVTSGTHSPTLERSIGMALVKRNSTNTGESILINIREKEVKAEVVKKPFYAFAGGKR